MKQQIKNINGKILFETEAESLKEALEEAVEKGANLVGAYLRDADFVDAFLRDARLHYADLAGAKLTRAYLKRADLRGADLRGADLRGANLSDAHVAGAYLKGAHLSGTNFSCAIFLGAYQQDVKSDQAKWDILLQWEAEAKELQDIWTRNLNSTQATFCDRILILIDVLRKKDEVLRQVVAHTECDSVVGKMNTDWSCYTDCKKALALTEGLKNFVERSISSCRRER